LIDIDDRPGCTVKIKVIGVGGGGNNAVRRMMDANLDCIDFIAANTDTQVLNALNFQNVIVLGTKLTRGQGAGGKPEIGRQAAEETRDEIQRAIMDTDMLFITAGMGGGTGTGAAPIVASIAKDLGILTVGIVTKPFRLEGKVRAENAAKGIAELKKFVDTLVIVPNEKLITIFQENIPIKKAFMKADEVLMQGVQGISELITHCGTINLDFADIRSVMTNGGIAHFGVGRASGKNKTQVAVARAIENVMSETPINGAKSAIVNICGDSNLGILDQNEITEIVYGVLDEDVDFYVGSSIDDSLKDEVIVTVIATGLGDAPPETQIPTVSQGGVRYERGSAAAQPRAAGQEDQPKPAEAAKDAKGFAPVRTFDGEEHTFVIPHFLQGRQNR